MGPYYPQSPRPCRDVLVLFPSRAWGSDLVETIHYNATNRTIRLRPRIRLLRFLHLFL